MKKIDLKAVKTPEEFEKVKSVEIDEGTCLEEQKPVRTRHFIILLYEDTTSYNFKEVLSICKSQKKWAYIKHFPESDEKKEHIHLILSFENQKYVSTLSKQLGVPEYFIKPIKNMRSICRYLIHKDDEEKYQYSLEQVKVSNAFEREFKKAFDDIETEDIIIDNIYKQIDSITKHFQYHECVRLLIQYVNAHCYDTIYKRYRFEFQDYLKNCCYNK